MSYCLVKSLKEVDRKRNELKILLVIIIYRYFRLKSIFSNYCKIEIKNTFSNLDVETKTITPSLKIKHPKHMPPISTPQSQPQFSIKSIVANQNPSRGSLLYTLAISSQRLLAGRCDFTICATCTKILTKN